MCGTAAAASSRSTVMRTISEPARARSGRRVPAGSPGGFRFALRVRECGVEARQFLRAFMHAPLQRFVRSFERLCRLDAGRDVGESRDDAAVRHAVCAYFDNDAFGETLQERFASRRVALELSVHELFHFRLLAAAVVETEDVGESNVGPNEARRQIQDFSELSIPAYEMQVLVEYCDALSHMIERGLQDFAIVLNRCVGIVEQFQRGLFRHGALAQQK